jgi:hypothetical protein
VPGSLLLATVFCHSIVNGAENVVLVTAAVSHQKDPTLAVQVRLVNRAVAILLAVSPIIQVLAPLVPVPVRLANMINPVPVRAALVNTVPTCIDPEMIADTYSVLVPIMLAVNEAVVLPPAVLQMLTVLVLLFNTVQVPKPMLLNDSV